jgi:acetyl-CoA acetyltransferase
MAIKTGVCNVALIAYGSTSRSNRKRKFRDGNPNAGAFHSSEYNPRNPIISYAFAAARHMHEYGTSRENLAQVAVSTRQWAMKNPRAEMRDPLTIEDVMGARMICDPLTLFDCCLVSDAGAAIVMVAAGRAKDFPQKPAYLLGIGSATSHDQIAQMPDLTVTPAAQSGPRAFAMAGVGPGDIDVAEFYDAFTINTILFLEDLGFCEKGEGGAFVGDGNIGPGGALPVNTNGGGLSCVHPGMYGMFVTIEAVEQLRGSCGERQIDGATIALANGNGGVLSSQVTAIYGTEAAL